LYFFPKFVKMRYPHSDNIALIAQAHRQVMTNVCPLLGRIAAITRIAAYCFRYGVTCHVCLSVSVSLLFMFVSTANPAEPIEMPFGD